MENKSEVDLTKYKFRYGEIKVSEVKICNDIKKTRISNDDIDNLIVSIKSYGLLQPIGVSSLMIAEESKQAKWKLLWGQNRLDACKKLGFLTIPALIIDDFLTEEEAKTIAQFIPKYKQEMTEEDTWSAIKGFYYEVSTGDINEDSETISNLTGIPFEIVKTSLSKSLKSKNSSPIERL